MSLIVASERIERWSGSLIYLVISVRPDGTSIPSRRGCLLCKIGNLRRPISFLSLISARKNRKGHERTNDHYVSFSDVLIQEMNFMTCMSVLHRHLGLLSRVELSVPTYAYARLWNRPILVRRKHSTWGSFTLRGNIIGPKRLGHLFTRWSVRF